MADVKFNIKINIDGKERVVGVTTDVKKLATEMGVARGAGDKLRESLMVEMLYIFSQLNMKSYLKSAMSYCDCFTLEEFIGKQKLVVNSAHTINSVNK